MNINNTNVGIRSPGSPATDTQEFGTAAQLGSSIATIYTAPSAANTTTNTVTSRAILQDMWLCNTDTVSRTFRLHIVASGGTASAANAIIYDAAIGANQSLHYANIATLVPPGGTIQGLASSASKVSYRLTGSVQL